MISLIQLLKEISSSPKAIIMAGGASVGKSTLLKSLKNLLQNFKNLNADSYVEDKNSPMYGNLSAASNQIKKVDLPNSIKNKQNIIYDTTASNVSTLMPILNMLKDNGYDVMMIMVYAHPIVSFLRNFKRERKVPTVGVLSTWVNTYNLIEEYKNIFKDNFILTLPTSYSPEEQKQIDMFQKSLDNGTLKEYFIDLLESGEYQSTFRKSDADLSPEELAKREKQREKTKETLYKTIDKIADIFNSIQTSVSSIQTKDISQKVKKFINE